MKAKTKRRIIDAVIFISVYMTLFFAGAGWWAVLISPLSIWSYWNGMTFSELGEN